MSSTFLPRISLLNNTALHKEPVFGLRCGRSVCASTFVGRLKWLEEPGSLLQSPISRCQSSTSDAASTSQAVSLRCIHMTGDAGRSYSQKGKSLLVTGETLPYLPLKGQAPNRGS